MANLYIIDTHTLLWYVDDNQKLGKKAGEILDDHSAHFVLPAIALAEALFILEKGRTPFTISEAELLQIVHDDGRIIVAPFTEVVVGKTLDCKSVLEMHDRQIVATALLAQNTDVQAIILTRDGNIINSGLVQTLW